MQLHSIDLVQVMHPSFPARNQISPSSPFLNAFIRHYTSHPTLSISLIRCPYGSGRKQCEMSPRTSRPEHSSYAIQVKTYIKFRTRAQHPAHPDSANRSQVIVCVTPRPSRSCKPPKSLQALHRHCMPFHRTPQIHTRSSPNGDFLSHRDDEDAASPHLCWSTRPPSPLGQSTLPFFLPHRNYHEAVHLQSQDFR
jgi:hypothetical protein